MADVLIALGGNVGDVRGVFQKGDRQYLRHDAGGLARALLRLRHAALGRGAAGPLHQRLHRDRDRLDPHALLFTLHKIEKKFGRDRAQEKRWGPRTLDLDLIAYDDVSIDKPELTLPHPRLFQRAFVLVPLAEIAPDRVIAGRTVTAGAGRPVDRGNRAAAATSADIVLAVPTWQFPATSAKTAPGSDPLNDICN